jgi:hypothetical protein
MTDAESGTTLLTGDPRTVAPEAIDKISVTGTAPVPF